MVAQQRRFRFTVEKLEALHAPTEGAAVYYDSGVAQLAIRVQPSGKRSFFVIKQVNGRPERKTIGIFPELKIEAARTHARSYLTQLADWKLKGCQGLSPLARPEKGFTFSDGIEAYIKYLHAPREKRPIKDPARAEARARWLFTKYLSTLKALPLEEVTGTRVESLHRSIGEDHGKISANRCVELIRAVFRYALKKKLTTVPNPTASVEKYAEKKRDRFLQPDELVRLRAALDAEPNRDVADFIELLLLTGVRKSSLYAARFEEISEAFEAWNIPTTKNGSPLTVQLTPKALAIVQARRARIGDGSPWLFPSAESASGHTEDFKNQFKRLRRAANIPDVTFHDLRRTCASYQAISGASLAVVGASLGHKSIESTQIYARLHSSAVRQSLLAGEAIQKQMMEKARKQLKVATA